MALVKPLVVTSAGEITRLQAGDTLDAPQSGGDIIVLTNDEVGAVVIGTPAYIDANDGFKKAKADAAGTSNVIGLVGATSINAAASGAVVLDGVLTATTGQWDAVTGAVGGLVAGSKYFVSAATAGLLVTVCPSVAGQYVAEVGIAISTTEMRVKPQRRILL